MDAMTPTVGTVLSRVEVIEEARFERNKIKTSFLDCIPVISYVPVPSSLSVVKARAPMRDG